MSKIFIVDQNKRPLNPIHSAQARQLLRNKKAAIYRRFPFTLILKEIRNDSFVSPLRLKLDPGAKYTGIALVNDTSGEKDGLVQGISHKFCKRIHAKDGYSYGQ